MAISILARRLADQALTLASNPRQPLALITIHRFLGTLDTEDLHFADAEYASPGIASPG